MASPRRPIRPDEISASTPPEISDGFPINPERIAGIAIIDEISDGAPPERIITAGIPIIPERIIPIIPERIITAGIPIIRRPERETAETAIPIAGIRPERESERETAGPIIRRTIEDHWMKEEERRRKIEESHDNEQQRTTLDIAQGSSSLIEAPLQRNESALRRKTQSQLISSEEYERSLKGEGEKEKWKGRAPIRGADIVARTTVTLAAGEGCTYEWKGHGLRLLVPEDALEPHSPPATITIQASLSGHYHLPDHTQLVSGVYWISFPGKFSRPVTLEVQHCASLQPVHETTSLTFVTARCTQETLPYNFRPITGGVFSADSRFATIELSHFSSFAVVSGDSENKRYTAHTYYIPQSPTTWLMHFAIICNLELFLQALREVYSGKRAETGPCLEVVFNKDEVGLEVEEDGVILDNGWSLVPLICPISVLRESVDSYKPGELIPSCQLELYWMKREPPDRLKHRVKLTGVRRHTSITITRDPAHPDTSKLPDSRKRPGSQHGEVEGISSNRPKESVDGDSAGPSTAHTVLGQTETLAAATDGTTPGTKPSRNALDTKNLFDVKSELIPVAVEWRNIGLALRLDDSQLGVIQRDNQGIYGCLTDMLRQWLNKTYDVEQFGQPSWQMLAEAVRSPAGGNNPALAAQIDEKHGGQ